MYQAFLRLLFATNLQCEDLILVSSISRFIDKVSTKKSFDNVQGSNKLVVKKCNSEVTNHQAIDQGSYNFPYAVNTPMPIAVSSPESISILSSWQQRHVENHLGKPRTPPSPPDQHSLVLLHHVILDMQAADFFCLGIKWVSSYLVPFLVSVFVLQCCQLLLAEQDGRFKQHTGTGLRHHKSR